MRILIADDHAIVRKGVIQILHEQYPFAEIEEADSSEELVKLVAEKKWDVVICDINMPGRSGLEALKQIKLMEPGLPVIIMSMYSENLYALRAFQAGASGYLGKETIHYMLIKAMEAVLSGKKFITPSIAEKLADSVNEAKKNNLYEYLSGREFEVLVMMASGKSTSDIAKQLSISVATVSTYRARILEKMKMKSNAELIRYALEAGIV